jgi:putative endonuclease
MWYTYLLYSRSQDKFYIGVTNDLKRRIEEHSRGKTQTTSRMKDFELAYYEASKNEIDAKNRERQLKTGFGRGYIRKRLQNYIKGVEIV